MRRMLELGLQLEPRPELVSLLQLAPLVLMNS
jgi:hypothetical protein